VARTPEERFWPKVQKGDGCWLWLAARLANGYGVFSYGGRPVYAHRFVYELTFGPLPEGTEIDHLCRNRWCVRPDHLEAVPHVENVRRGIGSGWQINAVKTHCPHGHEYTPANTYTYRGSRLCRACHLAHSRRSYQRRKERSTE
jgi:hypothetical protein